MLTITIDWLAGTFKEFNDDTETFLRTYASADDVLPIKPRNGYHIAQQDGNGVQFFWNSNDNRMGYHVVFTGSSLRNLLERQAIPALTLLHAAINAGMRVSRLDLAKDLTGQEIDGEALYKFIKSGVNGGTARNALRIENEKGGQTIYVGSRQSERYIRIYDKAQETGETSIKWWRMEIETKGDVARVVAAALIDDAEPAAIFDTTIAKMVGAFTGSPFEQFASRGVVSWGLPKIEKHTDREKWIAEQVISAVSEHFASNPDSEAVKALIAVLNHIQSHRSK